MQLKLLLIFILFLFLTAVSAKPSYIIDTDMGDDDWLAINYLLADEGINIAAISVVGTGEVHCTAGVVNALFILGLTQIKDIPVSCGSLKPLRGNHAFPVKFRQAVDSMHGIFPLKKNNRLIENYSSSDLIYNILKKSSEKINIIAIGPLTNIANLILKHPRIINKIKMIYIMGGAINVEGNINIVPNSNSENKISEWNFYLDPLAASIVLKSEIPITLFPLDVTNKVPMTVSFYKKFKFNHKTKRAEFTFRVLKKLLPFVKNNDYSFWDPLVAVVATNPGLVKINKINLSVNIDNGNVFVDNKLGNKISVVESVDKDKFERLFADVFGFK